jgi:hypothetical protein
MVSTSQKIGIKPPLVDGGYLRDGAAGRPIRRFDIAKNVKRKRSEVILGLEIRRG